MRCEVNDNDQTLTLKDYAYNTAGNGINAGQVTGIPGISEDNISITNLNKVLYVAVPSNTGEYEFTIINIMGQKMFENSFSESNSQIDYSFLNQDIYFLLITTKDGSFSRKVFLN